MGWFERTLLAKSWTWLQKCEANQGRELVFLHNKYQLIVHVALEQFLKLGDFNFSIWFLVKIFHYIRPFRYFRVVILIPFQYLQFVFFISDLLIDLIDIVADRLFVVYKISQVHDFDKHRYWVIALRSSHRKTEFEDDVWLVKIKDFQVVGQSFNAYCQNTLPIGTLSWDFVQFDVITVLCEVDLLIKQQLTIEELTTLIRKSIDDNIVVPMLHLTPNYTFTVGRKQVTGVRLVSDCYQWLLTVDFDVLLYVSNQLWPPVHQQLYPVNCEVTHENLDQLTFVNECVDQLTCSGVSSLDVNLVYFYVVIHKCL